MTAPFDGEFDFFARAPQAAKPEVAAPAPIGRLGFTPAPPSPVLPGPKASRWAKSDTTFGPVGRVGWSIALLIPFLFLVGTGVLTFDPFVLGGAGIWAVLMVMGLRQLWQVVQHHHRR